MSPHEQKFTDICLQCCPGTFGFTYIIILFSDFIQRRFLERAVSIRILNPFAQKRPSSKQNFQCGQNICGLRRYDLTQHLKKFFLPAICFKLVYKPYNIPSRAFDRLLDQKKRQLLSYQEVKKKKKSHVTYSYVNVGLIYSGSDEA